MMQDRLLLGRARRSASLDTVIRLVLNQRARLALAAATTVAGSAVTLVVPWLAARFFGSSLTGGDIDRPIAWLVVAALIVMALLNFAASTLSAETAARVLTGLRTAAYRHLQALPMAVHEQAVRGNLLSLITFEVSRVSTFFTTTLVAIPSQLLTAAGAVVLMASIDLRLGLIVPVLVPVFYIVFKVIGRRVRSLSLEFYRAEAGLVARIEENLSLMPAIKAFTREAIENERYAGLALHAQELAVRESRIQAALSPAVGLIAGLAAVAIAVRLGGDVGSGQTSSTEMLAFLFYAALLTRPVASLAQVYGQTQSVRSVFERLDALFEAAPEPGLAAPRQTWPGQGGIAFEDVHFHYSDREPVLRGVTLRIAPGEIVALTGENGSGKTTLINLLLRFHDPESGSIMIDGQDIQAMNVLDLRARIGVVSQNVSLLNGSIRDNIAFGNAGASDAEIADAAEQAQASEFIKRLPDGYATEIGDDGVRLSGGQRQRIALARALIKDPQILVLDEATSMYDIDGEKDFLAACATSMVGRTVILITHRPASLAIAHRIFEIRDGRIHQLEKGQECSAAS